MNIQNFIVAAIFLALSISTAPITQASNQVIVNGGFEDGTASGWTAIGDVKAVRWAHSGFFGLRFGSIFRTYPYYTYGLSQSSRAGQISQSFRIPSGKAGTLSFWYLGIQGDYGETSLRASLIAQNGTAIIQWDAKIDYRWHQVTYEIGSRYSDQTLTLRFSGTPSISYDYDGGKDCRLGRPCPGRVIRYIVYVYLDDISVTYT